ncbi:MAG: hypothetical protein ACRD0K_01970 [Egibacteraceae bacterium]
MIRELLWMALVIAFVLGVNAFVVAQWLGKLPHGDPDSPRERVYLLFPATLAALLLTGFAIMGSFGIEPPSWTVSPLVALCAALGTLGVVLWLWHPPRLRPRWQKEMIAEAGLREERRVERVRARARYVLDLVVDGRTEPLPAAFDDLQAAERAARSAVKRNAGHGEQVYAMVLDRHAPTAVRTVDLT